MARIITKKTLERHKFMQHFPEDRKAILDTILNTAKQSNSHNSVDLLKEINTDFTLFNCYNNKHKLKVSEIFRTRFDDAKNFINWVLMYLSQLEFVSKCCRKCKKSYNDLENA